MANLTPDRFVVYCLTNKADGTMYFGQTRNTLNARWSGHWTDIRKSKNPSPIQKALVAFGKEAFSGQVLLRDLTQEEADFWEAELITSYPEHRVYNEIQGGLSAARSVRCKARMSAAYRAPATPEATARRIASSRKATTTPEFREKMREVNRANWAKRRANGSDVGQAAAAARRTDEARAQTSAAASAVWAARKAT